MSFASPSLKGRALRLLGQREHSRTELERKLAQHEEVPGSLAQALDELAAKGFISEERVVQSVLHQRAPRMGAARLRQELQHKGIGADAIAGALEQLQSTELERARDIAARGTSAHARRPARSRTPRGRTAGRQIAARSTAAPRAA